MRPQGGDQTPSAATHSAQPASSKVQHNSRTLLGRCMKVLGFASVVRPHHSRTSNHVTWVGDPKKGGGE